LEGGLKRLANVRVGRRLRRHRKGFNEGPSVKKQGKRIEGKRQSGLKGDHRLLLKGMCLVLPPLFFRPGKSKREKGQFV